MANMRQARTDYGTKGESGEKIPRGATASDTSGEKRVGTPKADGPKGPPSETGASAPESSKASDRTGERSTRMAGGVGMGQHDALTGRKDSPGNYDTGEMNTGKKDGSVYTHNRKSYQ